MIAAVIPTLGRRPELQPLIAGLVREDVPAYVVCRPGINLYTLWNDGVELVRSWGADRVAVLNDDIIVPPNTMAWMSWALDQGFDCVGVDPHHPYGTAEERCAPVQVHGTYRSGGITGWCFMVRAEAWRPISDRWEWWFGDDELMRGITERGGRLGRCVGLGITHVNEGTASQLPETHAAKVRDVATAVALGWW